MDLLIFISASITADAILIQKGLHFAQGQMRTVSNDFNMQEGTKTDKRIQPNASNYFMILNKPV